MSAIWDNSSRVAFAVVFINLCHSCRIKKLLWNAISRPCCTSFQWNHVKLLSHILNSTSKALGRPSNLATKREMLSRLLGFNDWNGASARLPNHTHGDTHVGIALLKVPSAPPKTLMALLLHGSCLKRCEIT
jgi:hypothetical protein